MADSGSYSTLKKWLPFMAVTSAVAYGSTVVFQLAYYRAFGVDIFLVTPRTDPASLATLTIFIVVLLVAYLYMLLIKWSYETVSLIAVISEDILFSGSILLGSAVGLISRGEISASVEGFNATLFLVSLLVPIVAIISFWIRRIVVIRRLTRATHGAVGFKDAYMNTRAWGVKPNQNAASGSIVLMPKVRLVGTSLLLAVLSLLVIGNDVARSRHTFPMLVKPQNNSQATITVVVGKVAEGYIAKDYNQKAGEFKPGWKLLTEDNMEFVRVNIKSLKEQ